MTRSYTIALLFTLASEPVSSHAAFERSVLSSYALWHSISYDSSFFEPVSQQEEVTGSYTIALLFTLASDHTYSHAAFELLALSSYALWHSVSSDSSIFELILQEMTKCYPSRRSSIGSSRSSLSQQPQQQTEQTHQQQPE